MRWGSLGEGGKVETNKHTIVIVPVPLNLLGEQYDRNEPHLGDCRSGSELEHHNVVETRFLGDIPTDKHGVLEGGRVTAVPHRLVDGGWGHFTSGGYQGAV